jgi:hypothetical protein
MKDPVVLPEGLVIRLERMKCPGACPDYSLVIKGDGRIMYEGRRYVAAKGKRQGKISASQVRKLLEEFNRVGFFLLQDRYNSIVNDGSTTKTSIQAGPARKVVVNCHPSRAPESLYNLEKMIDEVCKSDRWVKRAGKPILEP